MIKVHVLKDGEEVGSYQRSYSSMMKTFHPFTQNEKPYALISDNYTRTAVISLPSCEIIAAEDANSRGFCPVEFYVPRFYYHTIKYAPGKTEDIKIYMGDEGDYNHDEFYKDAEKAKAPIHYENFAFLSGCVWGDDSTWKVQYLDLSRIEDGIIERSGKFGYVELAKGQSLFDAIRPEYLSNGYLNINVNTSFKMDSGEQLK